MIDQNSGRPSERGLAGATPAVITPDAVGLELPTATVGSRGIAWLLDFLILLAGLLIVGIATALLGGGGFVPGWFGIALLLLLAFAWQFGYPIVFELTTRGRTPGKMAMGLRVVTVEGAPVGFRHSAIRAVTALVELPVTLGAVAVVSSLVSARGQRLGDLAAGTMVVRERRVGGVPTALTFAPPPGLEEYAARLDTSALPREAYATIRDTLRRAPSLPPQTRSRITARLATVIAQRVTPPPPPGVPAEPWLWCVAAAVQRRRGMGPAAHADRGPAPQMVAAPPAPQPSPGSAMPGYAGQAATTVTGSGTAHTGQPPARSPHAQPQPQSGPAVPGDQREPSGRSANTSSDDREVDQPPRRGVADEQQEARDRDRGFRPPD